MEDAWPGCVSMRGGNAQRIVVNLHGQVYPGKPRQMGVDTASRRVGYFTEALASLVYHVRYFTEDDVSIVFPARIGCGLAGGDWATYLQAIAEFATDVVEASRKHVTIHICHLPKPASTRTGAHMPHDSNDGVSNGRPPNGNTRLGQTPHSTPANDGDQSSLVKKPVGDATQRMRPNAVTHSTQTGLVNIIDLTAADNDKGAADTPIALVEAGTPADDTDTSHTKHNDHNFNRPGYRPLCGRICSR